ncbi:MULTISPECIES: ParA family partition ATPase [Zooshikella]|uniref:Peptide transporter n=1 Tax=Zooshikella ganghwensis TaxID=202772 RepID=A0A4P9VH64_9GAMM|nr:ParA family partition ATPase [Zooshikella ganghwensis]RDH41806.1 peptide transporter [Zooshikella ganghwensis]
MAKVISFLNQKGGSTKTTNAITLSYGLRKRGKKVLLIDTDQQATASKAYARALESGFSVDDLPTVVSVPRATVSDEIKSYKDSFEYIVIDSPGSLENLNIPVGIIKASNLAIVPVQPSPYDIEDSAAVVEMIQSRREITDGLPKAAILISRTKGNTILGREIQEALEQFGLPIMDTRIPDSEIFKQTAIAGGSVFDANVKKNQKAVDSANQLVDEILNILAE